MTLRFLDLTALFRLLTGDVENKAMHHGMHSDKTWHQRLAFMSARAKQRRQLLSLSAEQLEDIGITHTQMLEEANKPFWQA